MLYNATDKTALKSLFETGDGLIESSFYSLIDEVYTITVPITFTATTSSTQLGQTTMTSFASSQSPLPHPLLSSSTSAEVVGFKGLMGVSSTAQPSTLTFKLFGFDTSLGVQRGYNSGTPIYINNDFVSTGAASSKYYQNVSDSNITQINPINTSHVLFLDVNPSTWSVNDIMATVYIRYTF